MLKNKKQRTTRRETQIQNEIKQLNELGTTIGKYEFRIKDTGVGMTKETLETIYNPFIKKNNFTKPANTGSGLGMVITKNIIDMMRGEININSVPNKGTEVIITLPLQFADDNENIQPIENYNNKDFIGIKILFVDDNPLSREIAIDSLTEFGFAVTCVNSGNEAIETIKKANSGDFDLILMDIQMPDLNGYEATKKIRSLNKSISKIPIIGMTGSSFKEDRISMIESGMNNLLPKPVQIDHLIEILAKYMKK